MAAQEANLDIEKNLCKLKRYLNLGFETSEKLRSPSELYNLICLKNLLQTKDGGTKALDAIKRMSVEGNLIKRAFILNALAYCARNTIDADAKRGAYSMLKEICLDPDELFYFIKMCDYFTNEFSILKTKPKNVKVQVEAKSNENESSAIETSRSDSVLVKTKLLDKRAEVKIYPSISNSRPSSSASVKNEKSTHRKTVGISLDLGKQNTETSLKSDSNDNIKLPKLVKFEDKSDETLKSESLTVEFKKNNARKLTPKVMRDTAGTASILKSSRKSSLDSNHSVPNENRLPKRGWDKHHRRAINEWYLSQDPIKLAYYVTRYKKRFNWRHIDILKMAHPKATNLIHNLLFKYITSTNFDLFKIYYESIMQASNSPVFKFECETKIASKSKVGTVKQKSKDKQIKKSVVEYKIDKDIIDKLTQVFDYLNSYHTLNYGKKVVANDEEIADLIRKQKFTIGQIPSIFYKSKLVWLSILENDSFHTIDVIRNLITMANNSIIKASDLDQNESKIEKLICSKLTDFNSLKGTFLHPLQIFTVLRLYLHRQRKTRKNWLNNKKWLINKSINDALVNLLDYSFKSLNSTNKRLSVSNNSWKVSRARLKKNTSLTPFQASILMCKSSFHSEPNAKLFSISSSLNELRLTRSQTLQEAIDFAWKLSIGSAYNFHLPLKDALEKKEDYDAFIIYSNMEPYENESITSLFNDYKTKMNKPNCKLVIVSLVANQSHKSLIDSNDSSMLEMSGINVDLPRIINNFLRDMF